MVTDDGEITKKVLLPTEEVNIWLKHLETVTKNRKKGAQKAAETRKAKTTSTEQEPIVYCGKCGEMYEEENRRNSELDWFHWICVGLIVEPESFSCNNCV